MKKTSYPVVHIPDQILVTPSKNITLFDEKLARMADTMKKTLLGAKRPKGVGLAGPQAGFSYRIFLTRPTEKSEIRVFINPIIIRHSEPDMNRDQKKDSLEGCLSIPNVWGHVHRSDSLTLSYQDEKGTEHTEDFDGFIATIIQHETDHVNGILFTRRVIEQNGKLFQTAIEDGKEVLQEIKLR